MNDVAEKYEKKTKWFFFSLSTLVTGREKRKIKSIISIYSLKQQFKKKKSFYIRFFNVHFMIFPSLEPKVRVDFSIWGLRRKRE